MTDPVISSSTTPVSGQPDAHGQAALLLVESLVHALIAKSTLSVEEAVEVIDVAAEIKVLVAEEQHERPEPAAASLALLTAMAGSLRRDIGG